MIGRAPLSSEGQFRARSDLITAALWLDVHLRRHPRLAKWIVPSTCREYFLKSCATYRKAVFEHDYIGPTT
jgi:hypothetical protein